ncbi:MAG: hypothetical protein JXR19_08250, partial [Bacteroidia bacterium]
HIKSRFNGESNYSWQMVYMKENWSVTSHIQSFQMNWLSSNIYSLDYGYRYGLEFMLKSRNQGQLRIQWSQKMQLENKENIYSGATPYQSQKIRMRFQYMLSKQLKLKTYFEINSRDNSSGHMIYNEFQWKGNKSRISLNTRLSTFHIPESHNAIYFYESVASGQNPWHAEFRSGLSYYLSIRLKLNNRLKLWLKYKAQTYPLQQEHYINSVLNSNIPLVNRKNTFAIQIQYRSD